MWWRLLHYAKQGLDDVGTLLTAWAIFKGIKSYWSSTRDIVLVLLWLLAFGRNPVKGLENISFNPFSSAPRKALTWGTLLALIVLAGVVATHVQQQKALSA